MVTRLCTLQPVPASSPSALLLPRSSLKACGRPVVAPPSRPAWPARRRHSSASRAGHSAGPPAPGYTWAPPERGSTGPDSRRPQSTASASWTGLENTERRLVSVGQNRRGCLPDLPVKTALNRWNIHTLVKLKRTGSIIERSWQENCWVLLQEGDKSDALDHPTVDTVYFLTRARPGVLARVWNGLDQSAGFKIQSSPDGFGLDWIIKSPVQRIPDWTGLEICHFPISY